MLPGLLGVIELEFPRHKFKIQKDKSKNTLIIDGKISPVVWYEEHEKSLVHSVGLQPAVVTLATTLRASIQMYFRTIVKDMQTNRAIAPVQFQTFVPKPQEVVDKELKMENDDDIVEIQTTTPPVMVETEPPAIEEIVTVESSAPEAVMEEIVTKPKKTRKKKGAQE